MNKIYGSSPSSRTLEGVVKLLNKRGDIQDKELVINDIKKIIAKICDRSTFIQYNYIEIPVM